MRRSWIPLALPGLSLATAAAPANGAEAASSIAPPLVAAAPLDVPIVDAGAVIGRLTFTASFELADPAAAAMATAQAPQLRAATLAAALDFARLHASPYLPVDAQLLSDGLTRAARAVNPGVRRVLIIEVRTSHQ
ncbi:MAG: hypothetical protein ACTHMG_02490 [Sphingomonas sp.]